MTSVAAAATRTATDLSTGSPLGKSSSQGDEQGAFAQALTDADAQPEEGAEGAELITQEAASSNPAAGGRFKALNDLASLQQLELGDAAATGAGAGSSTGAAPLSAGLPLTSGVSTQQDLIGQSATAQQMLQQSANEQAAVEDGNQAAQAVASLVDTLAPANEEQAAVSMDLTKLAGLAAGIKRATPSGEAKGQGEAQAKLEDTTPDAQADTTAIPADMQSAAIAAEALLQLMAGTTLSTSNDSAAAPGVLPVAATGSDKATDDLINAADIGAADDGSLDLLTSIGDGSEVTEQKSFRFQKAGDAAAAISLSIGKAEDGSAELQDGVSATDPQQTVVVLDSRRFLGFGMGSNASALLSAASGNSDWAAAMHPASALSNAARASSTGNVVNTLKLQLNPEHLGTVTANMRLSGDELSIHLTVHNAAAYRELNDDSKPMLEALRAQGFNVDQITVSLSSAADTGSNASNGQPQANSNAQAQQQQFQRDGEAGRQQPQSQSQSPGQAGRNDMENRNETAVEASVRGGGNAGSLYL